MLNEYLHVTYIKVKNCFVYLPESCLRKLDVKEQVIALWHNDKTYYMSCTAIPSSDENLCLSATFARILNIKENDLVSVSSVHSLPSLKSIRVIPYSFDDHDILKYQSDKVQAIFLSQIRIVAKNQPIVIWVSKYSYIILIPESLEPNFKLGKLQQLTEVEVCDINPNFKEGEVDKLLENKQNVDQDKSLLNIALNKLKMCVYENSELKKDNGKMSEACRKLNSFKNHKYPLIFRVNSLNIKPIYTEYDKFKNLIEPFNVFVSKYHLPKTWILQNGYVLCKLKKISEEVTHDNSPDSTKEDKVILEFPTEITVKLIIIEDCIELLREYKYSSLQESIENSYENYQNFFKNDIHRNIFISKSVQYTLQLEFGAKVVVIPINSISNIIPTKLIISTSKTEIDFNLYLEEFINLHYQNDEMLFNSNALIQLPHKDKDIQFFIKCIPEDCSFFFINHTLLKKLNINRQQVQFITNFIPMHNAEENLKYIKLQSQSSILSQIKSGLLLSLKLDGSRKINYDRENILICGESGSGKSFICNLLKNLFNQPPYFLYIHKINCKSLAGKKVESIQKIVTEILTNCKFYEPSVLIFDDIDSIVSAKPTEEDSPDSMNTERIGGMLIRLITDCQKIHYVSVISTCKNLDKMNKILRPSQGVNFFRTVLSIQPLDNVERIRIVDKILSKHLIPDEKNAIFQEIETKTEGWVVQDILDFATRLKFKILKNTLNQEYVDYFLRRNDIVDALELMTPLSLHDIKLHNGSKYSWSDIGGLKEVKEALIETLHWPLLYKDIFKNCPIKLQTGVLLYGMPGTGKTILAKSITNECGVHLISIKGPELLSKYIGVSEQSVREVFQRAQLAKPCVLFFDEFDSLAPRRGHDNTGVTDRVVNQLLTQLDGVEDRDGIAVVAATSRPDLLDPALLRPGRLDKSLYCPLPNNIDRELILRALCKSQNINVDELDLVIVVDKTAGYTGADLNAIITQAKLNAYEDAISGDKGNKVEDIVIEQKHLEMALESTKPSLSVAERVKYESIYARFLKANGDTTDMKNQRATLA